MFTPTGAAVVAPLALNTFMAGVALDVIHFPKMASVAGVASRLTPTMLTHLVWSAGPTAAAISAVATGLLYFYHIDRRRHAEIAETLRSRRPAGA